MERKRVSDVLFYHEIQIKEQIPLLKISYDKDVRRAMNELCICVSACLLYQIGTSLLL